MAEQSLRAALDHAQALLHDAVVLAPAIGQLQVRSAAREQRLSELRLELLDLPAHGALRDAELVGGAAEALQPRSSLERANRVQRRQIARHGLVFQ
jgi:hypothetical protein